MKLLAAALLLALVGCASDAQVVKPKRNSLLPPRNSVEALLPPVKEPQLNLDSLPDFEAVSVDDKAELCYPLKGTATKPACEPVPAGILVSERTYAEGIVTASEARRYSVEVATLRKLRESEWAAIQKAEEAYQDTVADLQTEIIRLETRSWWERHVFSLGLVLGAATTVALTFAVVEATN